MEERACTHRQQDLHPPMYLRIDRIKREREMERAETCHGEPACIMHANTRAEDPNELPSVEGQSKLVSCHRQRGREEKSRPRRDQFRIFTSGPFDLPAFVSPIDATYKVHETRRERVASCRFYDEETAVSRWFRVSTNHGQIYGDGEAWVFQVVQGSCSIRPSFPRQFWRNDERVPVKREMSEISSFVRVRTNFFTPLDCPFWRNIVLNLLRWNDVPRRIFGPKLQYFL